MDSLNPLQKALLDAMTAPTAAAASLYEGARHAALASRGPEVVRTELLEQIGQALEMLGSSKQQFWSKRLRDDSDKVRAHDPAGSSSLFRALWGMGSLSDLYTSGLDSDAEGELQKVLSGAYLKAEYLYEVDSGEPLR